MLRLHVACAALLFTGAASLRADPSRPTPPGPQPIGGMRAFTVVGQDDTLVDLAFRHRVGFEPLLRMNPGVDVWVAEPGTRVDLPSLYVLPTAEREGLVVNLPEMRAYDYTQGGMPRVYALAIGDPEDPTPLGDYRIGAKRSDPSWYVPRSIQEERPDLAAVVPPGPDNPLGSRWMTIGTTYYGIHGTNLPWSIGRLGTHGCVRMYDDEIQELFARVPSGTRIQLVYESVKLGQGRAGLVLEVHPDVYQREGDRSHAIWARLGALGLRDRVDPVRVERALREQRGTPVSIEPGAAGGR